MSRCLDVNLPLLALKDFDCQDVEVSFNNISIEADKQFFGKYSLGIEYDTVYIDFETCFESKEKINTMLMMYIYQLANKNIVKNLLTENKEKAVAFLKQHTTCPKIFENIIEISREKFIDELKGNCILLSNDEKLKEKVRKNKNIACFSNNIIEALIDWRA